MHFFAYLIDLGFKKLWKIEKPTPTPSRGPEAESELASTSLQINDLDFCELLLSN
jgi:hypothetical protein